MIERRVTAAGLRWRVRETGVDSGRTLLLLHGFAGEASYWDYPASLLAGRLCVAPDLPGHGGTDPPIPPERWRMDRLADAMLLLLDALSIERVDLVGYSMGGRAAVHLACSAPGRIGSLTLVGASAGIADPKERRERLAQDEELASLLEREGIEAFVARWEALPLFESQRRLPEEVLSRTRRMRLAQDPRALAAALRAFGTGSLEPLYDRIADLPMRVLLVAGEEDAKFVAIARSLALAMPRARAEVVPHAGHSVPLERPEAFAGLLESFLSRASMEGGIGS